MQKIIVHHRSVHHAQNSGYGRLADYLKSFSLPYLESKFPYALAKKMAKLFNQEAGSYGTMSLMKDYELLKLLIASKESIDVIHYLNAERDIRLGITLNKYLSKSKILASFHKPPEVLSKTIKDVRYLKKLNGAIAVGQNQVDFLKNWLNLENVEYIPHGVDTTFFVPNSALKKENTLLFVGQHLRDFEAFNYAVPRLKEKIPTLKINAVLRPDFANKIVDNSAINIFSGVNDDSLRKLYQEATLLFLPLKDVTACNSILEAMACGLPVISTAVGGNLGYLKNNSGILVPPNDYKALVDETISLIKDNDKLILMSHITRATALDFEWEKVASEVEAFYQKIQLG